MGAQRIRPDETFTVSLKLPPLKVHIVGLQWENRTKAKWRKRRMRLAHLQALKIDRRRDQAKRAAMILCAFAMSAFSDFMARHYKEQGHHVEYIDKELIDEPGSF